MPAAPAPYATLATERLNMLGCIRCGQCLTACPTFVLTMEEAEGPRGRIALARALNEGRIDAVDDLRRHEWNCLVCDACTAACPAGVHMDPLQVAFRADVRPRRGFRGRFFERLGLRVVLASPSRTRMAVRALAHYRGLGIDRLARLLGIDRLLGTRAAEDLMPGPIATNFVVPRGERLEPELGQSTDALTLALSERERGAIDGRPHPDPLPLGERTLDGGRTPTNASFFVGCVMGTALAELDRASIRVLRRSGVGVTMTAGQTCCGALHAHSGDRDGARSLFRANIVAFEADGDGPIVVNSAGCGAMLHDYGHHLRDDPVWAERAARFSQRIVDFSRFVARRPPPMRQRLDLVATYQDACHLAHAQRITAEPRALLRSIPGLELREMSESSLCCGSAGTYNLTNPETATALRERKLDHAMGQNPAVIVTTNPGCLLHLRAGLVARGSDVQVRHIAELLDEASAP
ncbi:MAG: (Fe-S)-binding protein [Chloroflexota bacterium]|nr:MAG: (Fe-S)-binding protein [Chloroflexota bacterium]